MDQKDKDTPGKIKEHIEKKGEESLPPCTAAPSAEHTRAHDNDEPCDDGREGIITDD